MKKLLLFAALSCPAFVAARGQDRLVIVDNIIPTQPVTVVYHGPSDSIAYAQYTTEIEKIRRDQVAKLPWINRHPVVLSTLCSFFPGVSLPVVYLVALCKKIGMTKEKKETLSNLEWFNRHPVILATLCGATSILPLPAVWIAALIIGDNKIRGKGW
jgi:hypothetical protein